MGVQNRARAAALVPFLAAAAVPAAAAEVTFALEGAEMVARGADGAQLAPDVLPGATVRFGDAGTGIYTVRIDAVIADPAPGSTSLYDLSVQTPGSDGWQKLCEPDPQGRTTAIAIPGSWHKDRFARSARGFTFACTAGARGKCLRLGYLPWHQTEEGESMAPYHAACTRMMRADYCGDGTPHTVMGTQVEVFDRAGIMPHTGSDFGSFEAAWGPDGALCVARARRSEFPLEQVLRACPRLAASGPCTEDAIWTLPGVLLGNRS
ncbi:MAG: ADYC domain-containing protein [Geminicoccaceae bacterium]